MNKIEEHNRNHLINIIDKIPYGIPDGWDKVIEITVGGLLYVGFSEVLTSMLVCISSQGQSVINCETGEIKFCEENYDEDDLIAIAEQLGNEVIHIAGIGGGGLRCHTKAGDRVEMVAPEYPRQKIVFMSDYKLYIQNPEESFILFDDYEIRGYGFSKCGRYLVIASSGELLVLKKVSNEI
ncbi:MAG: hypothetical protein J6K48_00660 [Lachnospiraceae bacterium]|nr:hypothetical protein [Lachnospiraceae bacterium]